MKAKPNVEEENTEISTEQNNGSQIQVKDINEALKCLKNRNAKKGMVSPASNLNMGEVKTKRKAEKRLKIKEI